jgi:hypothetical protein
MVRVGWMQAPVESWNPAPVETPTALARAHGYRWITALYALLASICVLLAHALAPALVIAFLQNVSATSPSVALAWTLFIGSFLLTFLLVIDCAYFAGRGASERTGRRGSGLAAAAIVATCGAIALALGGVGVVLAQASPLTAVNSPPLGVAALAYHEGMAGGVALFYCAAYLPLLLLASAAGLLGALRGVRTFRRARAGAPTRALPPTVRRAA